MKLSNEVPTCIIILWYHEIWSERRPGGNHCSQNTQKQAVHYYYSVSDIIIIMYRGHVMLLWVDCEMKKVRTCRKKERYSL